MATAAEALEKLTAAITERFGGLPAEGEQVDQAELQAMIDEALEGLDEEPEKFADVTWSGPHTGPHGGVFWVNSKTGRHLYQKEKPGKGDEDAGEDPLWAKDPNEPKEQTKPEEKAAVAEQKPASRMKSHDVLQAAPLTAKGAAVWQKKAAAAYKDDPEFRALADGVAAFTQGSYDDIRDAAAAMRRGEGWHVDMKGYGTDKTFDSELKRVTNPMAVYKSFIAGQDVDNSKVSVGDVAAAINRAIDTSDPLDVPIYRGLIMPHPLSSRGAGEFGQWLATVQPGDSFPLHGPTSFSADRVVAEKFAQGISTGQGKRRDAEDGVVIVVQPGAKGIKAAALSPWKNQQEVISSGEYEVVSVEGERPIKKQMDDLSAIDRQKPIDYDNVPKIDYYGYRSRRGGGAEGGVRMTITVKAKS